MLGDYQRQVIESAITIAALLFIRFLVRAALRKLIVRMKFSLEKKRITYKILNLLFVLISIIILAAIWGVDTEQLLIFLSSILTVLGIAFFAQWSILSNITAGLLLFFSHPIKIGDYISVSEKDYEVKGLLKDISLFFLHIQTDEGLIVTMPNNIVLQKTISILSTDH